MLKNIINKNLPLGPIGIFDSGYGGLTILSEIQKLLPEYDYIYLGDNSRAPYGSRSFDIVYEFTKQAVITLFDLGCNLVILACNTASAKALRTIQQIDLPKIAPDKRVLGIIRPTAEVLKDITTNGHIGILGTEGTIKSDSYPIEISKIDKNIIVNSQSCPMWVPIIENNELDSDGAHFFIKEDIESILSKDPLIDTLVLACTHYPLLLDKIKKYTPPHIQIVSQGEYIAKSLFDYLNRHPEMESSCSKNGNTIYYTTESSQKFQESATIFLNKNIQVSRIIIE